MMNVAEILGIKWDGTWYEGEPHGDLTEKERVILKALPEDLTELVSADLSMVEKELSTAQITALKAYQQTLKDERDDELLEKLTATFLKLVFQLGENGQALTAANLKPWRDKVKAVLGK